VIKKNIKKPHDKCNLATYVSSFVQSKLVEDNNKNERAINNAIEQYFFFAQETNTGIRQWQRQHNLMNRVYQSYCVFFYPVT